MNWCDERLGLDPANQEEWTRETMERIEATLASLPVYELVRGWREVNTAPFREHTSGIHAFGMYFDRIGHDEPERALAFILAEARDEPDDALVAMIAKGKLLTQLLHFNAARVVDVLERTAAGAPRLRWLMGGIAWTFRGGMIEDGALAARLLAIADEAAFQAWEERHQDGSEAIDFATLPAAELARVWVELTARSPLERERDGQFMRLFDLQRDLADDEPERALALVQEVVRIEENPTMLSMLAAGLLEDALVANGTRIIEAVEAEARVNARFRQVLRGVWLSSADPDVTERVKQATREPTT